MMEMFDSWVGKISWGRVWQPTPVFLPGESQGNPIYGIEVEEITCVLFEKEKFKETALKYMKVSQIMRCSLV